MVALVKALHIVLAHSEKERPELRAITRVEAHITFPRETFLTDRTTIRTTAANTPIVCNWATSIAFVLDRGKILRVYTTPKIVYLKVEGVGRVTTSNEILVPNYVAFDTETTGLIPEQDHIIEVGLVKFNNGEPVDRWTSLIKPQGKVGLKTLRLTGIALEDIEDGVLLSDVCAEIEKFRGDLPLVGHNPEFDEAFLSKSIPGFPGVLVYDTLELARIVYPGFKTYKLSDLAQNLNIILSDAHRACDDAEASGILFRLIQERIMSMSTSMRAKIVDIMGASWPMAHLFKYGLEGGLHQPCMLELDVGGLGVEDRLEDLVCDEDSLWFEDILRGDSKVTFVGSNVDENIVREVLSGSLRRSVTGDEILVFGDFGGPETIPNGVCFLCPPEHYLCILKARIAHELAKDGLLSGLDIDEKRFLSSVTVWEVGTLTGLFNELQVAGAKARGVQRELSCSEIPACTEFCPVQADCHYLKAAKRAESFKVIVSPKEACFDLKVSADIAVTFGLTDVMAEWEGTQPELDLSALAEALREGGRGALASDVERLANECLALLKGRPDVLVPQKTLDMLVRLYGDISDVVVKMRLDLRAKTAGIVGFPLDPPLISRTLHTLEYWLGELGRILGENTEGLTIMSKGYSFGDGTRILISKKSVWPAYHGRQKLLSKYDRLIFVSPEVPFIAKYVGLKKLFGIEDDDFLAAKVSSDSSVCHDNEGVILICVDTGRFISGGEHVVFVSTFLEKLAAEIPENILCLCPSYGFAKELNSVVTPSLEERSIAVFAQGVDGGPKIVEHLVEPDTVVLCRFGSAIKDIGKFAPRILVVPKIPFGPPNIIADLRKADLSKMGRNGFVEANVLPIALSLRSYIESIMRSTGKLAVIFLDPKLLPGQRGWGRDFMESFQDMQKIVCPQEHAIAKICQWLKD